MDGSDDGLGDDVRLAGALGLGDVAELPEVVRGHLISDRLAQVLGFPRPWAEADATQRLTHALLLAEMEGEPRLARELLLRDQDFLDHLETGAKVRHANPEGPGRKLLASPEELLAELQKARGQLRAQRLPSSWTQAAKKIAPGHKVTPRQIIRVTKVVRKASE